MRIAIVSDAWRPQINGVVRTIETVAQLLRADGHDVEVFGPDRFRTLPCPTYPEIRLSLFPGARLAHMLKLYAPDAIHLVTEGPLGWAARSFCLARDIPFTTAYHTRFPEYVHARIRLPLSWSYAFVRRFHAPSAGGAGGGAVDPRRAHAARLQEPGAVVARRRYRGLPSAPAHPDRRCPADLALCRAARRSRRTSRPSSISTCRAPSGWWAAARSSRSCKRRYKDARFFGSVDTDELSLRYAEADCFVFPSRTDTFGLVMVEALASGVPVAGYPVPGPLDVVTDPKVGALDEDLRTACLAAIDRDPADCRRHAETFTWATLRRAVPRHPAAHPARRLAAAEAARLAGRGGVIKAVELRRGANHLEGQPTERVMAALNHIIIPAKDKDASATFLADILGVKPQPQWGPFRPVQTSNGVTLDFVDSKDVRTQHYAFLVSDQEFDASFARIKKAGIAYFADHDKNGPGEINHHWGGRGVYFEDPNGHLLELITKPYGNASEIHP